MNLMIMEDKNNYLEAMFTNVINDKTYLNTNILLSLIYETNVTWTYDKGIFKVKTQTNKIIATFDNKSWAKLLQENCIQYHFDTHRLMLPQIFITTGNELLEKKFLKLLDKLKIGYFEDISAEQKRQRNFIKKMIKELFDSSNINNLFDED